MRRGMLTVLSLAAVGVWVAPTFAGPGCPGCKAVEEKGEGFCCGSGKIFDLKLTSKVVFDILAGDAAKVSKAKYSPCPACKEAATQGGSCEHCKLFVTDGKAYQSKAAFVLASGKPIAKETADTMSDHCPECAKAFAKNGFCTGCDAGFVAHRMFKTQKTYDEAKQAMETVQTALKDAGHCEACAVARLTDGKCEHCSVSFKNGKPSKG